MTDGYSFSKLILKIPIATAQKPLTKCSREINSNNLFSTQTNYILVFETFNYNVNLVFLNTCKLNYKNFTIEVNVKDIT